MACCTAASSTPWLAAKTIWACTWRLRKLDFSSRSNAAWLSVPGSLNSVLNAPLRLLASANVATSRTIQPPRTQRRRRYEKRARRCSMADLTEPGGLSRYAAGARNPAGLAPSVHAGSVSYSRFVAYQSLYRKYRPQRFSELVGQEHVRTALQNSVRDGRVGHAYLFSGPRGTGKTTTARLLAKALNCTNRADDGDPCGVCESCVAIAEGSSLDVIEVDAASKSKVDDMRDLLERVAYLSAGGAKKVYILDEVHMLSTGAEAALLKTLEESPEHVVFVLATTDPLKVAPTIRSRTQHYEFTLYTVDEHVAGALVALGELLDAGHEPRRLTEDLLVTVRDAFLLTSARGRVRVDLPDDDQQALGALGEQVGAPTLVRTLETLGQAVVDMRGTDAADPRLVLEIALVRLARREAGTPLQALAERVDRLERGGAPASAPSAPAVSAAPAPAAPSASPADRPSGRSGRSYAELKRERAAAGDTAPADAPAPAPEPAAPGAPEA